MFKSMLMALIVSSHIDLGHADTTKDKTWVNASEDPGPKLTTKDNCIKGNGDCSEYDCCDTNLCISNDDATGVYCACFPSYATVTRADNSTARIDALAPNDAIQCVDKYGRLTIDSVSLFSVADLAAKAAFITITTEAKRKLVLTAGHHLPIGPERALKQAGDVVVGDTVWHADLGSGALRPERVAAIDVTISQGLHNPLMKHGGMPIVNGVATSFNRPAIVALDSVAVPVVEALCEATGTCTAVRRAIAAVECAAKHAFLAKPVCKTFHYIDGAVVSSPTAAEAAVGLATFAAAVLAVGVAAVHMRARK